MQMTMQRVPTDVTRMDKVCRCVKKAAVDINSLEHEMVKKSHSM